MFIEVEYEQAPDLLAKAEPKTTAIYAAIGELNRYEEQIGQPKIERRALNADL